MRQAPAHGRVGDGEMMPGRYLLMQMSSSRRRLLSVGEDLRMWQSGKGKTATSPQVKAICGLSPGQSCGAHAWRRALNAPLQAWGDGPGGGPQGPGRLAVAGEVTEASLNDRRGGAVGSPSSFNGNQAGASRVDKVPCHRRFQIPDDGTAPCEAL